MSDPQLSPLRPTIPENGSCAACTLKHLRAAYAHSTALEGLAIRRGDPWVHHFSGHILIARAAVLAREALVGYCDNATLALGCLAAAETMAPCGSTALLREIRVAAELHPGPVETLVSDLCASIDSLMDGLLPSDELRQFSFLGAHLAEALREAPPEITYSGLVPLQQMSRDLAAGLFPSDGFQAREFSIHLFNIIKALEVHYGLETRNSGEDGAQGTPTGGGK